MDKEEIALRDTPCEKCPLKDGTVTFYNSLRKEWIHASAAQLEYPGCGNGQCRPRSFAETGKAYDKTVDRWF